MITVERVKKSYDRHAQNYDAGAGLQRGLADKLANAIQADGIKFSKVLDVGCGTGYLTEKLRATGCDISFGMLNCARDKSGRYIQSDASALPFADSAFDLIVSNAAYQWVRDLRAAFGEIRRALKPRGKFYFVAFNNNTLWQLQEACKKPTFGQAPRPRRSMERPTSPPPLRPR